MRHCALRKRYPVIMLLYISCVRFSAVLLTVTAGAVGGGKCDVSHAASSLTHADDMQRTKQGFNSWKPYAQLGAQICKV